MGGTCYGCSGALEKAPCMLFGIDTTFSAYMCAYLEQPRLVYTGGGNARLFESRACFMQLQIVPRREFQCGLRLIMRLASARTAISIHVS